MRKTNLFKSFCYGAGAACLLLLNACSTKTGDASSACLIPRPAEMQVQGKFLKADSAMILNPDGNRVRYATDGSLARLGAEGYKLVVDAGGIDLRAMTDAGLFYGRQTLLQLLGDKGIPYVEIEDYPRFGYRGLHLDVSRHIFSKEEILKIIDVMSSYKLNRLHLHLTDAGGWRLQMDKYPRLTSHGAFRTESDWRLWWDGKDRKYLPEGTEGAYGGYYTKDDMRQVVAYAAERFVTVIPEVEFPGHSEEVFMAYPELCCTGKPYSGGDFCIGNPKSYEFMEGVLSEIMEVFSSEYIHIGGDEAGKQNWKTCPKCQALMRKHGMKDVNELQSYFIHKVEEFVNSKGRRIIGWDEILEGGLAPRATVMSWRGESAGFQSARMGHDVVMTPGNYMYLDFYQANPNTQPYAIGGYTPVKKVYSYNPLPADSLTPEQAGHILGVQGNTWTEYIKDEQHLEYMMFPRALAVAEIGWTPQEKRDWNDFKTRLNRHVETLHERGVNAFPLSYEIDFEMAVDTVARQIEVTFDAEKYPVEIRYTTDGTMPDASSPLYSSPVVVKDSAHIVAGIFVDGKLTGNVSEKKVDYHRGINKPISYNSELYAGYMAGGMNALLDGYRGGLTYLDGRWQGYLDNLDCVVDLGAQTEIHKVSSRWMQLIGPGVFQPEYVELYVSDDGRHFTLCGRHDTDIKRDDPQLRFQEYVFAGNWEGRYVRIKAKNPMGFIFTDEIVIW